MNNIQQIFEIIHNFKIDKKFWYHHNLSGDDYDNKRSKPTPYIKTAISIAKLLNLKTIVEIGSTRFAVTDKCLNYFDFSNNAFISPPCCCDGHGGFFWSREGFDVHTVDIDENCKNGVLWSYENIKLEVPKNLYMHIPKDGIDFLKEFDKNIDVLYLDGWDVGTQNYAEKHLEAFLAAENKLSPIHLILIDDTDYITEDGGKDKLLSPFLLQKKYLPLFNGRQTLFAKL